ncbi:MAG: hypothetical protein K5634_06100 [Sphaerochaetaceae bacterium]|nr:hypothetical protein [Sphaerochaetaceae bacterium]
MKKLVVTIAVMLVGVFCFASLINGQETYKIATEHFLIVYPAECSDTASRIYDNCEDYYREITDLLGMDQNLYFPVIISNIYTISNAYYTPERFSYICLYDTGISSEELSTFGDSILSIFRHELTHAILCSVRDPFYEALSKVFGTYIAPSEMEYQNRFIAEGIAVYSESRFGEGRLNDARTLEIIKQAKIEDLFPSFGQVNGPRDISLAGQYAYMFGGAFMKYLSDTYGEDTLMEYFRQSGTIRVFSLFKKQFIKIFNVTPEEAWEAFKATVPVPESVDKPDTVQIADFRSGQSFSNTSYSDGYFYTSSLDGSIFKTDTSISKTERPALVYSVYNSLDAMGGYILANHTLSEKTDVALVSETGEVTFFADGCKTGCLVSVGNSLKAVTCGCEGQLVKLYVYDVTDGNPVLESEMDMGYDKAVLSLDGTDNGYAVLLVKDNIERKLVYLCLEDFSTKVFSFPENVVVSSISCIDGTKDLVISYSPDSPLVPQLSRLGRINAELENNTCELYLSDRDISGGVSCPSSDGVKVFYIGKLTEENITCCSEFDKFDLQYSGNLGSSSVDFGDAKRSESYENLVENSQKYNKYANIQKGSIYPFGYTTDLVEGFYPGLTWITNDLSQSIGIFASAQYDIKNGRAILVAEYSDTSLPLDFSLSAYAVLPVMYTGNTILGSSLALSKTFVFDSNNHQITVSNTSDLKWENNVGFEFGNCTTVAYANLRKTGVGTFDVTGMNASLTYDVNSLNVSFGYRFGSILPVKCPLYLTYNLPLTLSTSATLYTEYPALTVTNSAKFVLFSWEIQDMVPALPLYAYRMTLSATYTNNLLFDLKFNDRYVEHSIMLALNFTCTPSLAPAFTEYTLVVGPNLSWNLSEPAPEFGFTFKFTR